MSFAIGHFAFGATLTALLLTLVYPTAPLQRTLIIVGGGWAMLPDVSKLFPENERLIEFHDSSMADLFWFHGKLDAFDASDSVELSALFVAVLIVVSLLTELRYHHRSRARPARRVVREIRERHDDAEVSDFSDIYP